MFYVQLYSSVIIHEIFQPHRAIQAVLVPILAVEGVREVMGADSSVHTVRLPGVTLTETRGVLAQATVMLSISNKQIIFVAMLW